MHVDLLWLSSTICTARNPFMIIFYCLHRLQSLYDCFLLFARPTILLWLSSTVCTAYNPSMIVFYCLHRLQSLYDCFLPFATLAYLLWLLPTIYNDLLYPVDFNFQTYLISITIFEQLLSCGNKMRPTPKLNK
jgi:hypothetical protein